MYTERYKDLMIEGIITIVPKKSIMTDDIQYFTDF